MELIETHIIHQYKRNRIIHRFRKDIDRPAQHLPILLACTNDRVRPRAQGAPYTSKADEISIRSR